MLLPGFTEMVGLFDVISHRLGFVSISLEMSYKTHQRLIILHINTLNHPNTACHVSTRARSFGVSATKCKQNTDKSIHSATVVLY